MPNLQLCSDETLCSDPEQVMWRKLTASADMEGYPHHPVFTGTAESLWESMESGYGTHCRGKLNFECIVNYEYEIPPDTIPLLTMKGTLDCWLAALTVLLSYRDQVTYTTDQVLDMAGAPYPEKYAQNKTLSADEFAELSRRVGLEPEPPVEVSYTPCDILSMLLTHGPIFMVVDLTQPVDRIENPDPNFGIYHSLIVTGEVDRESAQDSVIKFWDVLNGGFYEDTFDMFLTRFNIPPEKFRPRYLLLPATAGAQPDLEGAVDFGASTCVCEKHIYNKDDLDERCSPVYEMGADFVYAPSKGIARATIDIHSEKEHLFDMEIIGGRWEVEISMQ